MTHNDILRRIRYALDISNPKMVDIFSLAGQRLELSDLDGLLKKDGEAGFIECSSDQMAFFLDGLIVQRRGQKEPLPGNQANSDVSFTNNSILKKLRIALDLKEDDMISIMQLVDVVISKSELSALFRNKVHKNYKVCGDQFLRNFLKGLTIRNRNIQLHSD